MEILVICGSPKGDYSITLQTALYMARRHPEHHFEILHAGRDIKKLEKDFAPAKALIEKAELLIFCYPVYTFLCPSQLHRFIELMKEKMPDLNGRWGSQLTTSKHFYDITAHTFIEENMKDCGLKVIRGLSQDMDDLLTEKGRKDADAFFDYLQWNISNDLHESPALPRPAFVPVTASVPTQVPKTLSKKVAVLTDAGEQDAALWSMISRFRALMPCETTLVNLREFPFKGGCISCFRCAAKGECIWKDGFDVFLREQLQTCDAIVTAFKIKDHSMGSLFKLYDDRQFCNGHRTVTMGKPTAFIADGALSLEENLSTMLEARAQVGGNFPCGVASDEHDPDEELDCLCMRLSYALEHGYTQPATFYGVGGMKIFRDLIWLMQGLMRADHQFFKSHGQYDFPQKKRGTMLAMYAAGAMMNNEKLRSKMGGKLNDGMIASYRKVVEAAQPINGGSNDGQ